MKLVQINSVYNTGSTGRIVAGIAAAAKKRGWLNQIYYGRPSSAPSTDSVRIESDFGNYAHGLYSYLLDGQGLGSRRATSKLINEIAQTRPDAILLHNLHGYYLNYAMLFNFLNSIDVPIFWTWHDCWPVTGHCAHFVRFNCLKWKGTCNKCPMTSYYPRALIDRSTRNHILKKHSYRNLRGMTIVCPSKWIEGVGKESFMKNCRFSVIHNGVDLVKFSPGPLANDSIILGVASYWSQAKGLNDFVKLRELLPGHVRILLVGITREQKGKLPPGIESLEKIESVQQLASIYAAASVFCNPTYGDTFPTTNIEALAAGVPVVTYKTGGSPEAIDRNTGSVVEQGDIQALASELLAWLNRPRSEVAPKCRQRAERNFDQDRQFGKYIDLVESSL